MFIDTSVCVCVCVCVCACVLSCLIVYSSLQPHVVAHQAAEPHHRRPPAGEAAHQRHGEGLCPVGKGCRTHEKACPKVSAYLCSHTHPVVAAKLPQLLPGPQNQHFSRHLYHCLS